MGDYKIVVVGTDGSDTSLLAVDKAAAIAAESGAKLIIAMAYLRDERRGSGEPDQPRREDYKTEGGAPIYDLLRDAKNRATRAGAHDVEERPVTGAPVEALVDLVEEVDADLLVVGDVGLNSFAGRLFGSVPAAVRRRAKTEVLVVETS